MPAPTEKVLNHVIAWLGIILVVSVVGFGAYYYWDRLPGDTGPSPLQQSLTRAEVAVRANPTDVSARMTLGAAYFSAGRYSDSVMQYRNAVALDDKNLPAINGLGRSLFESGNSAEAATYFQKILDASQNADLAPQLVAGANYFLAKIAITAKNYDEAIAGYEAIAPHKRSLEQQQNLKFATFWRADCAFDQGAYQEAIRLYFGVADQSPQDATALVALIQIVNAYTALNDIPAARTAQNRAWQLLRDMPSSAFDRGPLPLNRDAWERVLKSNELTAPGQLSAAKGSSP